MTKRVTINILEYNEGLRELSSSFSCGNIYIDRFIKSEDSLESDICKTFIMVQYITIGNQTISKLIGFYSLSSDSVYSINDSSYSNKIIYEGGAIRIYMFAIDESFQHKKVIIGDTKRTYASFLLLDCLNQISYIVENHIGATYIILNATEAGVGLYKNTGEFEELKEDDDICVSFIESDKKCKPMYKFIKTTDLDM